MFGKKAARIRELEDQLAEALRWDDQDRDRIAAVLKIGLTGFLGARPQLRPNTWYRLTASLRVTDVTKLDVAVAGLGIYDHNAEYFDGTTPSDPPAAQ